MMGTFASACSGRASVSAVTAEAGAAEPVPAVLVVSSGVCEAPGLAAEQPKQTARRVMRAGAHPSEAIRDRAAAGAERSEATRDRAGAGAVAGTGAERSEATRDSDRATRDSGIAGTLAQQGWDAFRKAP